MNSIQIQNNRLRAVSSEDGLNKPKLQFKKSYRSIKDQILAKKFVVDTVYSNFSTIQEKYMNEEPLEAKLAKILETRESCILFRLFLKEQKCEENIGFWVDIELFKREENDIDLRNKADAIYKKYFAENALYPVNVDCEVKEELRNSMDISITRQVFDRVQSHITGLMETSLVQKFLNSAIWKRYEEEMNCNNFSKGHKKSISQHYCEMPKPEENNQAKGRLAAIMSYKKSGMKVSESRMELERLFAMKDEGNFLNKSI